MLSSVTAARRESTPTPVWRLECHEIGKTWVKLMISNRIPRILDQRNDDKRVKELELREIVRNIRCVETGVLRPPTDSPA